MSEFLKREIQLRKLNEDLNKLPQQNGIHPPIKKSETVRYKANHSNTVPRKEKEAPLKSGQINRRITNNFDSKKPNNEAPKKSTPKLNNKPPNSTCTSRGGIFKKDTNNTHEDHKRTEKQFNRAILQSSKELGSLYKDTRFNNYVVEEKYVNHQFTESPSLMDLVRTGTNSLREEKERNTKYPQKTDTQSTISDSIASTTTSVGTCTDLTLDKLASLPSVKLSNGTRISNEGILQFLKSKVSILQEELETNTQDIKKKNIDLIKAYERQKKLEIQRDQIYARNSTLSENLSKMETKVESIEKMKKEQENELNLSQKQLETLKRDFKLLKQANNNLETRLERTNNQLEAANNCITQLQISEKTTRDNSRAEKAAKEDEIKILRKRNSELLSAYRKQLFLIDNLKQQVMCHEGCKASGLSEKEFGNLLKSTDLRHK